MSELPPNFSKYSSIIKYFRDNGLDCLSSLHEQLRFFIRYIYVKIVLNSDFHEKLKSRTNLLYKHDMWGKWSNPDIDSYDSYNINALLFDVYDYRNLLGFQNKVTKEFLYKQLSEVSDIEILSYFDELYSYGRLKVIEHKNDNITISNKFNDSKIIITEDIFKQYVGYHKLVNDYNILMNEIITTFVIDINFNDKVAEDISTLLNENKIPMAQSIEELEQRLAVMDFLQISYNYDKIS